MHPDIRIMLARSLMAEHIARAEERARRARARPVQAAAGHRRPGALVRRLRRLEAR